ncbi:MAG: beta-mannosidase [Mycobacterium sp.]
MRPQAARSEPGSRVSVVNGSFTLDGKPWWPIGFDAYELGINWAVNAGCGAQVDLDRYFASLPPNSLTRFDVFAPLARNSHTGATDFTALDAVFAAAERHGRLLVASLSSGEGACDDGGFKDQSWYAGGWSTSSYATWLDTAVARWGRSRALAGWELVGEPEPGVCGDKLCQWRQRACPPGAGGALRSFFDNAGSRLRTIDSDTPIWAGMAGGGQCGSGGDDYATAGQSPGVDVLDRHDYGPPGVLMPGNERDGVQRRQKQAAAVGKPLVVAEMGQPAGSCRPLRARADDLERKARAQRRAGSAGVLLWAFVPDPRRDHCTLDKAITGSG